MRYAALLCAALLPAVLPAQDKFPDLPGKAILLKVCNGCHPAESIAAKRHTREEWEAVIDKMTDAGATATDEEFDQIVDYLAKAFPKPARVNVNRATAAELAAALGIPTKQAEAIVAWRTKNGSFQSLTGLKKVPGLDPTAIDAHKDQLQF